MAARDVHTERRERSSTPACAWCGAPTTATGGSLALCPACGAATTAPVPDDAELELAYAGWYRPSEGRFSAGGDRLLRRSRALLARRLADRAPNGPVLDVGSGEAALLDALRAAGRQATGLERASNRSDVVATEIEDFDRDRGEWAAVVFWHSLEHLRRPAVAIDRALALLAPGGLVVIAVPNLASWQARALGPRWLALDLPRHLVHLPAATLINGLSRRGLMIERVSYWRGGQVTFGWLHGLVQSLPGRPDLYAAIRRPQAQSRRLGGWRRMATLLAGALLTPVALVLAAAEIMARAGGTIYIEARKP